MWLSHYESSFTMRLMLHETVRHGFVQANYIVNRNSNQEFIKRVFEFCDIEQVIEKLFVKYHVKYCKRGLHLVSDIFN